MHCIRLFRLPSSRSADADAPSQHGGHALDVAHIGQGVPVHREKICVVGGLTTRRPAKKQVRAGAPSGTRTPTSAGERYLDVRPVSPSPNVRF